MARGYEDRYEALEPIAHLVAGNARLRAEHPENRGKPVAVGTPVSDAQLLLKAQERTNALLGMAILASLGATQAAHIQHPSTVLLPNPTTQPSATKITADSTLPRSVRVLAVGYQQGAVFVSRTSSGGNTAARSSAQIANGQAMSFFLLPGDALYAQGPTGGASTAIVFEMDTLDLVQWLNK